MLPVKLRKATEEARISRLLFSNHEDIIKSPIDNEDEEQDEENESNAKRRKHPQKFTHAWQDDDDDVIDTGKALDAQGRKLPEGGINERTKQYSDLLKHKFETIVGNPDWARLEDRHENNDDEILQTVGHIAKSSVSYLKKGLLEFKKLKNLNTHTRVKESILNVIKFHPKSSVALVAGKAGILSLLAVDGKQNEKLHCVSFKKYPIRCGHFTPSGEKALLGSHHPYYYIYDLMNAKALRIPLPSGIHRMDTFELSRCGKYLAVAGKFGEIHLLCAISNELIQTLKQNGEVTDMCFSPDSTKLYSHSSDGNVTVWTMNSLRVTHKWADDGCISGSRIEISPSGEYLATGSYQGVVNVYSTKDTMNSKEPVPKKILLNLTTTITGLRFNPHSEILSFHSSLMPNAFRLMHIPSFQVYSNFPVYPADFGHISTIEFSPGSGFFSFGTNTQLAYLYRLKHYKNY